jgi:hypothetical protein
MPDKTPDQAEAVVVSPGGSGRPTIELRINADGTNEAFLVPQGAQPVPTGIALVEKSGKYFVHCRIRNKLLHFRGTRSERADYRP